MSKKCVQPLFFRRSRAPLATLKITINISPQKWATTEKQQQRYQLPMQMHIFYRRSNFFLDINKFVTICMGNQLVTKPNHPIVPPPNCASIFMQRFSLILSCFIKIIDFHALLLLPSQLPIQMHTIKRNHINFYMKFMHPRNHINY